MYARSLKARPFKTAAVPLPSGISNSALPFQLDKMQPLLLTVAAVATLLGSAVAGSVQPRVQTSTGGTIIGHGASNRTSVMEFLGIRYAEAPVDELRFAAPKKYVTPQGTVFEASEWVCFSRLASICGLC